MTIINKRHCEGFARGNPEKYWSTKVDPTSTNVKFIQSYPPRIKRAYGRKLLVSALRTLLGWRKKSPQMRAEFNLEREF